MGSNGEEAHRVAGPESGTSFRHVDWTPDGRRVAWIKFRGNENPALESCDPGGGSAVAVFSDARLRLSRWMPGNRIILSMVEFPPNDGSHNLWELRIDPRSHRPRARPRRITNWVGTVFLHLSATADGERLAFNRAKALVDISVSEFDVMAERLKGTRRLIAADRANWPSAWTPDSRALLFHSDRNGNFDVYRRALSDARVEVLAGGSSEQFQGQFGPDGASLLYLEWDPVHPDSGRLMRAPVSGDPPLVLFTLSGRPVSPQREYVARTVLNTNVYPSFRCSSKPDGNCVIGEVRQGQVVFTVFDAASGARGEILKTGIDPRLSFWDLAPDGSRIAVGSRERKAGRVRILPVAGGSAGELIVKDQARWRNVGWAADGKSLFVTLEYSKGGGIVHVTLDGKAKELYRTIGWVDRVVASPDGRYLAYSELNFDSNVWMLEHFR